MNWAGLAALGALLAGFAALFWFTAARPHRRQAEALQRLAAARGWRIERHPGTGGRGFRIEVTPLRPEGWSCTVMRYLKADGGTALRGTEFTAPGDATQPGAVAIGPGLDRREMAAAGSLLAGLGPRLLMGLLGDQAEGLATLAPLPALSLPGASVFAAPDAPAGAIAAAYAPLLHAWSAKHRKPRHFPILVAAPRGLRLRLRIDATDPALLGAFIDHALASRAALAAAARA